MTQNNRASNEVQTPMSLRLIRALGPTGIVIMFVWRGLSDATYMAAAGPQWLFWVVVAAFTIVAVICWIDLIRAVLHRREH